MDHYTFEGMVLKGKSVDHEKAEGLSRVKNVNN